MPKRSDELMVWIDLEMTGLDPDKERIIEAAVLLTDAELEVVAEGPELVIHQSDELLAGMDAWNTSHHGDSGLTERVRQSTTSEADAQAQVLHFLKKHTKEHTAPLAGNSVWQDRRFLNRYMPAIDDWLHYRIVDVSTIKELARRWYPTQLAQAPAKKNSHRALDDIRESISELAYYREHVFRAPS
jgi:oligoribonuclease